MEIVVIRERFIFLCIRFTESTDLGLYPRSRIFWILNLFILVKKCDCKGKRIRTFFE